jgi:3-methylcrotonyl-CoA carboxylase alpha subunit
MEPPAELLAQAALFLLLRDQPPSTPDATPWTRLVARRFGGDVHTRTLALETEVGTTASVKVFTRPDGGLYDITVSPASTTSASETTVPSVEFRGVSATLSSPTALSATLAGAQTLATVVSQQAPGAAGAAERLHVFCGARAVTVLHRGPAWAEVLGSESRSAARGSLRAPMPSLVVEVRVAVGERVEKDQVVVVLESMKTETVLRAPADGIVRAVGCAKGEMVEEGRELIDVEESQD